MRRVGRVRRDDAARLLAEADSSLLDLVDHALSKGVVVQAEVWLGLGGVDLIYLRLTALFVAAGRIFSGARERAPEEAPGDLS
jgi:hypothetical protein